MRALHLPGDEHVVNELQGVGVDPQAFDIFLKKARCVILKLTALSPGQANVLKQTALVCGADAAIPRTAYSGNGRRKVAVLLFANERELGKIRARLVEQPWLFPVAQRIDAFLREKAVPFVQVRRKRIAFPRTFIMGVINVTPDSFYDRSRHTDPAAVRRTAEEMEQAGADIIDIGAESSRPGAEPVSVKMEIERLRGVLPIVRRRTRVLISVDTRRSAVAGYAIDNGASFINDISALKFDRKMPRLIARSGAGLILMHMKGTPRNMQRNPRYENCMEEIYCFLEERITHARNSGIDPARIIVDPGLGFGKRLRDNYEIINRLEEFALLKRPICVGHSRKSFIGQPGKLPPEERLEGTIGTQALLIRNGANILRVHDVGEAKKAAVLIDTILS